MVDHACINEGIRPEAYGGSDKSLHRRLALAGLIPEVEVFWEKVTPKIFILVGQFRKLCKLHMEVIRLLVVRAVRILVRFLRACIPNIRAIVVSWDQ